MINKILSIFKKPTITDPLLGEVEIHKDMWEFFVDLPQLEYKIECNLYFYNQPSQKQKDIVLYFKNNLKNILDESVKVINSKANLEKITLNRENILQNFRIKELLITKSKSDEVSWEIAYQPTSFDAHGHIFNVIYVNTTCDGLAIDS